MCVCVSVCSHAGKPELRSEVDIIVADVAEPDSLVSMCKQAVIVLNCVGPVSISYCNMCPNSMHPVVSKHTNRGAFSHTTATTDSQLTVVVILFIATSEWKVGFQRHFAPDWHCVLNRKKIGFKVKWKCCLCVQYRFFGEPVVKACVENGAHHVDISGEPQVCWPTMQHLHLCAFAGSQQHQLFQA